MDKKYAINEIKCCLKDCGFNDENARVFVSELEKSNLLGQIRILEKQRKQMLDEMHTAAKKIDCIDYMIHECKTKLKEEN